MPSRFALLHLTRLLGGPNKTAVLTSGEYADVLGVSQQTASRHLIELQRQGLISRKLSGRRQEIRLTSEGIVYIESLKNQLNNFFKDQEKQTYEGIVTSGLGEGAYYVKTYAPYLRDATGWMPHPGTLNLSVDRMPHIPEPKKQRIPGFSSGERSFGAIDVVKSPLNVSEVKQQAYLLLPERTHKQRELEFIAPQNLRKKHGLKDGDKITFSLD